MARKKKGNNTVTKKRGEKKSFRNDLILLSSIPFIAVVILTGIYTLYNPPVGGKYFEYHFRAQQEKIHFDQIFQTGNQNIMELVKDMSVFTKQLQADIGMDPKYDGTGICPGGMITNISFSEMENRKAKFWVILQKKYPELSLDEYSRENYGKFINFDLPKYMATKGIFVFNEPAGFVNMPLNFFTSMEYYIFFHPVRSIEKKDFDIFGQARSHDIVYIDGDFLLDGQSVNQYKSMGCARLHYGNIYVNLTRLDDLKNHQKMVLNFEMYRNVSSDFLFEQGLLQETTDQFFDACIINLAFKTNNYCSDRESSLHDDLVHEAIHAYAEEEGTKFYKCNYGKIALDNPYDLINLVDNQLVNIEIDAMMGSMCYSQNIADELYQLFCSQKNTQNSFQHDRSRSQIFDLMIKYILDHPKNYDKIIPIDDKYGYREKQVMFHLSNFVNHPQEFRKIFLELLKIRQSSDYEGNFSRNLVGEKRRQALMEIFLSYIVPYLVICMFYIFIGHPELFRKKLVGSKKK